eukprot:gene6232-4483_t
MPNVVVTCVFNPPVVSIQGASLRQDTIDALQKVLPKRTSTSLPTQRQNELPKFMIVEGGESDSQSTTWRIDLGQHYCCQKGRSLVFLSVMEALQEEGYAMRGTHSLAMGEKDVTRMIFSRE